MLNTRMDWHLPAGSIVENRFFLFAETTTEETRGWNSEHKGKTSAVKVGLAIKKPLYKA